MPDSSWKTSHAPRRGAFLLPRASAWWPTPLSSSSPPRYHASCQQFMLWREASSPSAQVPWHAKPLSPPTQVSTHVAPIQSTNTEVSDTRRRRCCDVSGDAGGEMATPRRMNDSNQSRAQCPTLADQFIPAYLAVAVRRRSVARVRGSTGARRANSLVVSRIA